MELARWQADDHCYGSVLSLEEVKIYIAVNLDLAQHDTKKERLPLQTFGPIVFTAVQWTWP